MLKNRLSKYNLEALVSFVLPVLIFSAQYAEICLVVQLFKQQLHYLVR